MCDHTLQCNAEEADTRLWLHAIKSERCKMLVFSPDTDTLFIGQGMVNVLTMDVVIQVGKGASDKKFIHLNALVQALSNDVDLNPIPTENRSKVLQSLFVLNGCDCTSFFVGFGKVVFFKAFYAYSEFTSGESGALSHLLNDESYLAFLHMIGVDHVFPKAQIYILKLPFTHGSLSLTQVRHNFHQTTASRLDRFFKRRDVGSSNI